MYLETINKVSVTHNITVNQQYITYPAKSTRFSFAFRISRLSLMWLVKYIVKIVCERDEKMFIGVSQTILIKKNIQLSKK